MRNTNWTSVILLLSAFAAASATKPTATNTMFGIRGSEHEESAIQQGQQHMDLRGGSMRPKRRWGILEEVKDDLLSLAAQRGEEANHRCSSEEVFHECVINYGSVMLGRF